MNLFIGPIRYTTLDERADISRRLDSLESDLIKFR